MGDIKVGRIVLGMYQTNCYYLYREGTGEAIVADPADSGDYIYDALNSKGLSVKAILLTHGHFDHIYGVKALSQKAGCKVYAYEKEADLLNDPVINHSEDFGRIVTVIPDELLRDGQNCTIAGMDFEVISTPGHTVGSCCYYFKEAGILLSGDTLFCGSVGRTDLHTGNGPQLINSIIERLLILPDETRAYPGHGDSTTIGFERENNPFL